MLVRTAALRQVGLLDETFFMYAEDRDWCMRFWQAGWKVAYVPSASIVHYGGASSANAPLRFALEMERSNLQFCRKHYSFARQLAFRFLAVLHHGLRLVANAAFSVLTVARNERVREHWAGIRLYCGGQAAAKES
jgi:GT2 family glycosyltransferase